MNKKHIILVSILALLGIASIITVCLVDNIGNFDPIYLFYQGLAGIVRASKVDPNSSVNSFFSWVLYFALGLPVLIYPVLQIIIRKKDYLIYSLWLIVLPFHYFSIILFYQSNISRICFNRN